MKYFGWLVYLVWIVCIPLLIISSSVTIVTHSIDLYTYGFNKYQISAVTGISQAQLEGVAQKMIDYFYGKVDTPQVNVNIRGKEMPVYSAKELTHLADVRDIVRVFGVLQVMSIILLFLSGIYTYFREGISKLLVGLQMGAMATVAFTCVLVIWSLVDFNSLFILFHLVSFNNNLWILDPSRDYLIMMFPEGFFNDAAILLVSAILLEAMIILIAAVLIRKKALHDIGNAVSTVGH